MHWLGKAADLKQIYDCKKHYAVVPESSLSPQASLWHIQEEGDGDGGWVRGTKGVEAYPTTLPMMCF